MKTLLTIFTLVFTLMFSSTSFALSPCQGDDETKWQNCEGILTSGSGKEYVGVFNDGIFDGESESKIRYVGEYKNGTQHGQGTYTFADGRKYVGELKDGKYHGQGTLTWADGRKYVGEFKDDKYHGQGTFTLPDGGKYVGEYKNGNPNGQGTYTFADGRKYVGEWKDYTYHGQGTLTWADGERYVGEWKDDKYHGQGTYTWADGRKYVGEYKNGNHHGQGTYTFADGRTWQGTWDNNKWVSGDKYETQSEAKSKSFEKTNDNIRLALDILNYTLMGDKKSRDSAKAESSEECTFSVKTRFGTQTLYVDNIIPDTVMLNSKKVYFSGDDPVLDDRSSGSMVLHVDADLERVKKAWGLLFSKACEGSSPSEF